MWIYFTIMGQLTWTVHRAKFGMRAYFSCLFKLVTLRAPDERQESDLGDTCPESVQSKQAAFNHISRILKQLVIVFGQRGKQYVLVLMLWYTLYDGVPERAEQQK